MGLYLSDVLIRRAQVLRKEQDELLRMVTLLASVRASAITRKHLTKEKH